MKWIEHRLHMIGRKKGELAEYLDVPASRMSDLISGKRRLLAGELLPLTEFLKMDLQTVAALCHAQQLEKKKKSTVR